MNATSSAMSLISPRTYAWSRAMCRTMGAPALSDATGAGFGAAGGDTGEAPGAAAPAVSSAYCVFDFRRLVGGL